jgi:DNA primase
MIYEGVGEVDVVDMLETLGLENVAKVGRGEVQYSCPFTEGHAFGDSNPSAHMNRDKLVYRCKGCSRAGTALDLVGTVLRCSPIEALRWLRARYGDVYRPPEGGSIAEEMRLVEQRRLERRTHAATLALPDEGDTIGPLGIFYMDWKSDHEAAVYMRETRGFDPEPLAEWGFGYDSWTNRVTIPFRDPDGRLVGFKGRTINPNEETRYLILGDTEERKPRYGVGYGFDMHDHHQVLFGIDRAIKATAGHKRKVAVVNEGELNAYALQCAGVLNAVGIGTTTITETQERLLRWYFDELILFYDSDEAGHGAVWGYFYDKNGEQKWHPGLVEKLSPHLGIRIVPEHEGDPASMTPEQRRELASQSQSWFAIAVA